MRMQPFTGARWLQVMGARADGLEGGHVLENGSPDELLAKPSGM
jgi:hypothetical protein